MRRESIIYVLAFLVGVLGVNLLGNSTWVSNCILNRYSLITLSFNDIEYETYFYQILFLRFRTVMELWIMSRLMPKRVVVVGFLMFISILLGSVAALSILANGVWGILFYLGALIPHIFLYGSALAIWSNTRNEYTIPGNSYDKYMKLGVLLVLVGIGCVLEAYVSPVIIKNIVNY